MAYLLCIIFHLLSQELFLPCAALNGNEHLDFTNPNTTEVFFTIFPSKLSTPAASDLSITGHIGTFSVGNRTDTGNAKFPSSGNVNDQNAHSICLSLFNPCNGTFREFEICGFLTDVQFCDTRCVVYGDCSPGFRTACPDIYEEALLFNASLPPQGKAKCLPDLGALVIADCPPSADVSTTLQDKCREGVKVHDEEFVPVTDAYSALYYSNTFCAMCNSVHSRDVIPWLQIVHVDVSALSLQEKGVDISELEGVHFIFRHALGNGILGNDWVSWRFMPPKGNPRRCVPPEIPSSCDYDSSILKLVMRWRRSDESSKLVELETMWVMEQLGWRVLVCRVEGTSLIDCSIRRCGKKRRLRRGRCEFMPIVRDFAVWVRLPPPAFLVELSDSDRRQLQSSSNRSSSSSSSSRRGGGGDCSTNECLGDIFKTESGPDRTEEAMRELSSRALEVIQDAVKTSFHNVAIKHAYISSDTTPQWSARIVARFAFPWSPGEPSYQPLIKECQLSSLRNMRRLLENFVAPSKVVLCFKFGKNLQRLRHCEEGVYLAEDPGGEMQPTGNGGVTTHGSALKLLPAFTAYVGALVVLIL